MVGSYPCRAGALILFLSAATAIAQETETYTALPVVPSQATPPAQAGPTCWDSTSANGADANGKPTLRQRSRQHLQNLGQGTPREGYVTPFGQTVYAPARVQATNGAAARMVLYQYDFIPGSDQLKPRGREEVARISMLLAEYPFPLVIERSECAPALDEARRGAVLAALHQASCPVGPDRVVVGRPIAIGQAGWESAIEFLRLSAQSASGGTGAMLGGGGVGAGGGLGGGAGAGLGLGGSTLGVGQR